MILFSASLRRNLTSMFLLVSCLLSLLPSPVMAGLGSTLLSQVLPQSEQEENLESPVNGQEEKSPPASSEVSLFFAWAGELARDLVDLRIEINTLESSSSLKTQIPELKKNIEILHKDILRARDSVYPQYLNADQFQQRVYKLRAEVERLNQPVIKDIQQLSAFRTKWKEKKEKLASFKEEKELDLQQVSAQVREAEKTIATAVKLINQSLTPLLNFGSALNQTGLDLYTTDLELQKLRESLRQESTKKTSPSMLTLSFYQRVTPDLFTRTLENIKRVLTEQFSYLKQHLHLATLLLLFWGGMVLGIRGSGRLVSPDSRWYPFSRQALATSVFMLSVSHSISSMLPFQSPIPQAWETCLHMLAIVSVTRLAKQVMASTWSRVLLIRLAQFMVVTLLLITLNIPETLILLFIFYTALGFLLYYLYQLRGIQEKQGLERWIRIAWGIMPLAVFLFGAFGYDQIAFLGFRSLSVTVIISLASWMLYKLNMGLVDLGLSCLPMALVRNNRLLIVESIRPAMLWLHFLFMVAILGVGWSLAPTFEETLEGLNQFGLELGGLRLGPGLIVTVVTLIFTIRLLSQGIQALLLGAVLPRYASQRGVQLSIARLVHYAVLCIGFLILLRVLGFELKQLALIGGALGLGISFGLQAIINNFASGLILLFERPIKVGDTVEIGNQMGEVKKMGLRATVIQTFDNAEIVVPNSDLITGQFTNWTLADRKVRVRMPVGVAYGSDVAQVKEILLECANNNPMVMTTPAPLALFLAFGASSLDFELRVWIPEFLDKLQLVSELNTDIESEFALHGIEIPFPQQDLHLRSVAQAALGGVVMADAADPDDDAEASESAATDSDAAPENGDSAAETEL